MALSISLVIMSLALYVFVLGIREFSGRIVTKFYAHEKSLAEQHIAVRFAYGVNQVAEDMRVLVLILACFVLAYFLFGFSQEILSLA